MKRFLCNLIVPMMMFVGLLTLPIWVDKVADTPANSITIEQGRAATPAADAPAVVARAVDPG